MLRLNINRFSKIPTWATVDPYTLSANNPHTIKNLVGGRWKDTQNHEDIVDPLNGEAFIKAPLTNATEAKEFVTSAKSTPITGLHNMFKNPERFNMYGDICFKISQGMRDPDTFNFFTTLNQRIMPKSWAQTAGEVTVTRKFFDNFAGDYPRILQRGFTQSGDHPGQFSNGYRFPYGSVCVISPFNFPLEIPALQIFGALICGNKPTVKIDQKMGLQMEQFIRFAQHCGMPMEDMDYIHSSNQIMESIIMDANFRNVQFTGSSKVAEHLATITKGKCRIEDAGFDWKILGPDVQEQEFVAYQCDQDAYAASGQKCSAQSILYCHENWIKDGIIDRIAKKASTRKLSDLTVGPVITWNNEQIQSHIGELLQIKGAKVLFGGKPLKNHSIPEKYGSFEPTAVFVPLEAFATHFDLISKELFGPFQVVTEYNDSNLDTVIAHLTKFSHHLTAAVVSNNMQFINKIAANSVNGVTYTGIRARTTGAPQNHWFGPCGDPRGAGIGSPEALLQTWTSHREVVTDIGPVPADFQFIQS